MSKHPRTFFQKWLDLAAWTLDEAAELLNGSNPDNLCVTDEEFEEEYQASLDPNQTTRVAETLTALERSVIAGDLGSKNEFGKFFLRPNDVIEWAANRGIEIPGAFLDHLQAHKTARTQTSHVEKAQNVFPRSTHESNDGIVNHGPNGRCGNTEVFAIAYTHEKSDPENLGKSSYERIATQSSKFHLFVDLMSDTLRFERNLPGDSPGEGFLTAGEADMLSHFVKAAFSPTPYVRPTGKLMNAASNDAAYATFKRLRSKIDLKRDSKGFRVFKRRPRQRDATAQDLPPEFVFKPDDEIHFCIVLRAEAT